LCVSAQSTDDRIEINQAILVLGGYGYWIGYTTTGPIEVGFRQNCE